MTSKAGGRREESSRLRMSDSCLHSDAGEELLTLTFAVALCIFPGNRGSDSESPQLVSDSQKPSVSLRLLSLRCPVLTCVIRLDSRIPAKLAVGSITPLLSPQDAVDKRAKGC